MCAVSECIRLAGHMQIALWDMQRQAWMLGSIRKHEGMEKERGPATLLHISVN